MMQRTILTSLTVLGLCLGASAATIFTQWDFNDNPSDGNAATGTLVPSVGTGTAVTVGGLPTTYNAPAGSSDPLGADLNNSAWRMNSGWPAQGTGNKTCGVQLNISTVGYENITLMWDQANSATANKYWRVQYSIDNGATWVDKDVLVNNTGGNIWMNGNTVSFASIPGANSSPDFGVRIVSEFQSTAVGGSPNYFPVGTGSYAVTGVLRLDMVTFTGDLATGNVNILTEPTNHVVAVGQPVSFSVVAGGGTTPITYQWRKDNSPMTTATNSVYAIAAAQHSDAAGYDVIVANGVNSRTSAVATLTVRDPLNLAWTGLNGAYWDTTSVNWINTSSLVDAAYTGGDNVLFDSRGSGATSVTLNESVNPSSVTVDADFDYTLRSDVDGKVIGAARLTKRGSGTLVLDTDNTYTGPTDIQGGIVQLGLADAHGSMGSGPVTNNGAIVFNRSTPLLMLNPISGTGSLTNIGKTVTLVGTNVFNGPIYVASGSLELSGSQQVINSSDLFSAASTATGIGGATRLVLSGGIVVGSGTAVHLRDSTASPDCRCSLASTSGTNTFNGPLLLEGSGPNNLSSEGASTEFRFNGNVIGTNLSASGNFFLRGTGFGVLNGTINLPNTVVNKTDTGTWTINSSGNAWGFTALAVGTLRLGTHNALPTGLTLQMGQNNVVAMLDLGGFNQQLGTLNDAPGTLGPVIVTNSSATANSTLTVGAGVFSGSIADSALGPKTALTVNGTSFTLGGFNPYSGDTTVAAGTLALSGAGDIPNSAIINLAGGGLNVSTRSDGTLNLNPTQTLKGNGTFSITGNLANNGVVELKVNKTNGGLTHDKLAVSGQLTSGGTLKLVLSGQALNSLDTIPVFAAGTYAGSLPVLEPAVPAPGATWDTSTLLTDGLLRVSGPPRFQNPVLLGTSLTLSGLGGTPSGTFSILTSTNVAAPRTNWTVLQSGSFDTSGNFNILVPITSGESMRFYQLQLP